MSMILLNYLQSLSSRAKCNERMRVKCSREIFGVEKALVVLASPVDFSAPFVRFYGSLIPVEMTIGSECKISIRYNYRCRIIPT